MLLMKKLIYWKMISRLKYMNTFSAGTNPLNDCLIKIIQRLEQKSAIKLPLLAQLYRMVSPKILCH